MSIFRFVGLVSIALLASACQPADLPTQSVRSRLESGQLVDQTGDGFRYKGCPESMPDWADIRLGDEPERRRVVQGRQGSIAQPGRRVCYRIGSVVDIKVPRDDRAGLGRAKIVRIAWIQLDKLRGDQLQGRYFSAPDAFYLYKDKLRAQMSPRDQGVVSIVDFIYLNGSAVDEKTIIGGDMVQPSTLEGVFK